MNTGIYKTRTDKQLSHNINKYRDLIDVKSKSKNLKNMGIYIKKYKYMIKERDNRLQKATMSIKNLIN